MTNTTTFTVRTKNNEIVFRGELQYCIEYIAYDKNSVSTDRIYNPDGMIILEFITITTKEKK